jgi:transposase
MYEVESEAKRQNYSSAQRVELRRRKAKPILDDFFKWLSKKSLQVVPKSLLGLAVNYTLKQWDRLVVYLGVCRIMTTIPTVKMLHKNTI